jgi:hypothetical protein
VAESDSVKTILKAAGYDLGMDVNQRTLARIVGCEPTDSDFTERLQEVITLAVAEWLGWAAASRRFNSLSELDTARVLNLFLEVRHAPPTVEALVEQLAIPQGRATSMIGRMKYGQARQLVRLSFVEAEREVRTRLASVPEGGQKTITVARETLDRLRDVEFEIFYAAETDYTGRELLTVEPAGRLGALVKTSTKMWEYILAHLADRATA